MEPSFSMVAIVIAVVAAIFIIQTFKIVPQQNAWVVERLHCCGRVCRASGSFAFPRGRVAPWSSGGT